MGQKVHPYGFRLGFNKPWRSRWFAKQGYAKLLQEDLELKAALTSRLKSAGVSAIEIERPGKAPIRRAGALIVAVSPEGRVFVTGPNQIAAE